MDKASDITTIAAVSAATSAVDAGITMLVTKSSLVSAIVGIVAFATMVGALALMQVGDDPRDGMLYDAEPNPA